ncbi:putative POPLD domain-containing protein [Rosellinia necatrix]|uniref:Putative POPLD domain-containing protein n=1 Tax=Rosellinia necatrix TaxID=77044 RepID=A0A1W2TS58_ROSNE|nr:putative POPLD domain-containing protein [Rosellinia necatrix]
MPPKQALQGKGGKPPRSQGPSAAPSRAPSAGFGPSSKRKQGDQGNNNSLSNPRAAKRTKVYESRSIAVQSPHAALQDGELNVQSFVNSMAFEINALDESMRRSRTSGASRAFQRVPFTMRRRTAAHNYKRIPKRLHKRAKHEMVEDNTPTVNSRTRKPKKTRARLRAETAHRLGILAKRKRLLKIKKSVGADSEAITARAARPKIRTNELNDLPVTAPRYRKRQLNKTWLPTHIWHAKRARITPPSEPQWGFSLPLTPTQKNYRPTHRIQWEKGAMCWDMSYMATIGLFGKENIIQNILKSIGLGQESLWNNKGIRWRIGAVHWTGNLSREDKNTARFIGPATIFWNPPSPSEAPEANTTLRQLFIRIHPSAFFEAFNELLRLARAYKPRPYLQDLRHEIGSIDVTGPDATEALLGVLKPFESNPKESHVSRFETLLGLRDPASLPLGSLLSFSIIDPRLKYPPQQVRSPVATNQQAQIRLLECVSAFRKDEPPGPYQLFDRDARFKSSKLPSQKSLNRRRGKTSPGTALEPGSIDPPIPIILLACRNSNETRIPGTWTILLPWKCVKPVWYSLMHYPLSTGGNPSFGGLDEIRQLAFERGQPWFPGDVPGTDAGNAWETRERQARRKTWDRKPKGKRVNWESLDLGAGRRGEIGVGWSCDFETLFNLRDPKSTDKEPPASDGDDDGEDHDMPGVAEPAKPSPKKQASSANPEANPEPLAAISYLPKSIFNNYLSTRPASPLPPNSTITVCVKLLGRGVVTTCARIYRLPVNATPPPLPAATTTTTTPPGVPAAKSPPGDALPADLREQWLAQRPARRKSGERPPVAAGATPETRRRALAASLISPPGTYPAPPPNADAMGAGRHPLCPGAADLVGFVTTGSFNMRDGRGEAIATLSARLAAEEMARYANPRDPAARVCVVRDAGQGVGWLARWEIV